MTTENTTATVTAAVIPLQRAAAVRGAATFGEAAEAYMACYAGRDPTRGQRVQFWVEQEVWLCVGRDSEGQPTYERVRFGSIPLAKLDSDHVGEVLDTLASGQASRFVGRDADGRPIYRPLRQRSGATVNRYRAACQAVLKFARERRMLPKGWQSPFADAETKRKPESRGRERFLSPEEVNRLLAACRASAWPKLRLLVLMAITTGARKGELLGLRFGDLDLTARTAELARTKNGDRRVLPLHEAVIAELRRTGIGRPEELIFPGRRGLPRVIEAPWRRALKDAGLQGVCFHSLRHTAASHAVRSGKSLYQVGKLLGHRSPAVTQKYAHLLVDDVREMVDEVWATLR